jgi:hypothetical protein
MALFFSGLYVNTVAKGLFQPGEQARHQVSASHAPWWSMGIPTFQSQYPVLATNQRLVLVKHEKGFFTGDRMERVERLPRNAVQEVEVGGMFAKKNLRRKAQGTEGQIDFSLGVTGGMFEVPRNVDDGKAIAQRFGQMKAQTKALPS